MSLAAAYAVPHPPLIVPAVGRGQEQLIADTIAAYKDVALRVAKHTPDTIVIVSPHAPAFRDGFFVSQIPQESGSMANFGHPQETITTQVDVQFAQALAASMKDHGILCAPEFMGSNEIDHGSFVPLHFLEQELDFSKVKVVRIGLSGVSAQGHKLLGKLIAKTAEKLGRSCVLIASGDWSHKLKEDGPYGFVAEGPQFDAELARIFTEGDLEQLFTLDSALCEMAAECGLRSFQIMAGALEGSDYTAELLSYEGPFGVGYGIAAFEVADPLVALARETVEMLITTGKVPNVPAHFPKQYLTRKAGVFVSLHEHGELRGCIGTIAPNRSCIAEEVIANAVSAAASDPRFPIVRRDELDFLEYSVDVLGEPELVIDKATLDPKCYGVIVSQELKRGVLLPDLEGIDTVEDQLTIAKRKAGIPDFEQFDIERFEVVRHSAGGQARA